ncbi:cell wall hydrolase [Aminobacter sp. MDW-2]|uniref:cell wall hydrolase n=1 Tax=Aminobacter sp. MDW-2 TaxID=2666139 RepID=UPI0012B14C70|nr:cell wall hydrolase [Aminobacter sp. MDW-2]MRX31921.1 hypothetical protein [Aminobacter sp. MDW-2]QNH32394.1 cell wall hydrolase [Aminobacter sp. MDW-2]
MAKVKSVVDTILGEATYGTPQQRYADMVNIASVIANRAAQTRTTPQQVVSVRSEFNAYGKPLPSGVEKYRSLAQQALDDVLANGPKHNATFYATPKAAKNLPKGLKQVASTSGHVYFTDPQNRAIRTAVGFVKPVANAVQQVAKQTVNALGDAANAVTAPVRQAAVGAGNIASALRTAAFPSMSPPPRPSVDVPGMLAYDLAGAKRNQIPTSGIGQKVSAAANSVIPGTTTTLYSGMEPRGLGAIGAKNRHPLGFAGDFHFTAPNGQKITDPVALQDIAMSMAAQHNANIGYGQTGYMGPGRMHIDTMPLDQFPGGAQWGNTAKSWANNLDFARATGIGPTPYTNAPTPSPRPSPPEMMMAAPVGRVERAPLQAAALRMPDAARFAYDVPNPERFGPRAPSTTAKTSRLPASTVARGSSLPGVGPTAYTYEGVPEAARRNPIANLASKAYGLVSSDAQAAPRPNNPSLSPAALGRGSVTAPSFSSARMVAPQTSVPTQRFERPATPTQQAAAYNQYAQSRMAPVEPPAPNANMSLADQYASYGAGRVPNPTPALNAMMSPVATVAQSFAPVAPQPQFVPAMPITPTPPPAPMPVQQVRAAPRQQFPSAPPAQPQYTAADVYAGRANSGVATGGNMVSRDQYGNTSVTNKYGVTTTTNANGQQMASSGPGIGGPLGSGGIGSVFDAQPDLNGRSKFGNTARQVGASMAGSAVGGLLGPIGSLLGAALAGELAKPGAGRVGDLLNGVRTMNINGQPMQFARPQSGGAFPNAPSGGFRDPTFSNRSDRSMRDISPNAARDIRSGTAGLF